MEASAAAPRGLSRTARIAVAVVAAAIVARVVLGSFVVNEWEGWGTFVAFAVAAVVEGLFLGALVFGVVAIAARRRGRFPAVAATVLGLLAAASLAVPYSAPQPIIGAGAVALGLVGADRQRASRASRAAVALGLLVIAVWVVFLVFAVATDDWPVQN